MKNKKAVLGGKNIWMIVVLLVVGGVLFSIASYVREANSEYNMSNNDTKEVEDKAIIEENQVKNNEIESKAADANNGEGVQSSINLHQKADASYERWLAAAMVTAISLHYSDFQINGIYLTAETELSSASESSGAYVAFTSGEESLMICSKPLEEERTEAGTIDLYTMDLGFATFDEVDLKTVNTEGMLSVEAAELSELISQSMLVSLYER